LERPGKKFKGVSVLVLEVEVLAKCLGVDGFEEVFKLIFIQTSRKEPSKNLRGLPKNRVFRKLWRE